MVEDNSARYVCEDCMTVKVDCEKKVALRIEGESDDVLAMRER